MCIFFNSEDVGKLKKRYYYNRSRLQKLLKRNYINLHLNISKKETLPKKHTPKLPPESKRGCPPPNHDP